MGIFNKVNEEKSAREHPGNTHEMPGKHQGKVHVLILLRFWIKGASLAKDVGIFNKVKEREQKLCPGTPGKHPGKHPGKVHLLIFCIKGAGWETKRLIFHDVEMIIIQYVIDNCSYCCMQAQKFA